MYRRFVILLLSALSILGPIAAQAGAVLQDWCVSVNGDSGSVCNGSVPGLQPAGATVSLATFDAAVGTDGNALGSVVVTLGAGNAQNVLVFMDYDLNFVNTGSFADSGSIGGVPPAGVTFQLSDPAGGIFTNFATDALDNTFASVAAGQPNCCDVSWALGVHGINVANGMQAVVTFLVSSTQPVSGFFLKQTNSVDGSTIYLSENVSIEAVPEPSAPLLLGIGMIVLAIFAGGLRRRA